MKARLNQWSFNVLAFSLAVLFRVADLMPQPRPEGRHRGTGRATRAGNKALAKEREQAAMNRHHFQELSRPRRPDWIGDVGQVWTDAFDMPPLPQRRFRALAPRALAASSISAREALRRDQEALRQDQRAIAQEFGQAMARILGSDEVS